MPAVGHRVTGPPIYSYHDPSDGMGNRNFAKDGLDRGVCWDDVDVRGVCQAASQCSSQENIELQFRTMGNSKNTRAILQQLDKDRFKDLCTQANALLDNPLPISDPPTTNELVNILRGLAQEQFKKKYNYEYQGDQSQTPSVAEDAKYNIQSAKDICNITDDQSDQIENYVNSRLLGSSFQPDWAREPASADLVNEGNMLFQMPTKDSWLVSFLTKNYNAHDARSNSVKLDAVLVYCNIDISQNRESVVCTIISYAGVYYQVLSPTKVVERELLDTLIRNANSLLNEPQIISPSPSIQELNEILVTYAKTLYLQQFGFPYDGGRTIPSNIAPCASMYAIDALCFIKNNQPNVLPNFVDSTLNMMLLPSWVQDLARTDLLDQLTKMLLQNTGNNWTRAALNRSYNNSIPLNNSCQTKAMLVYTSASLTMNNITVSMIFIQYIGVYYGTLSPLVVVTNNLLSRLYDSANNLLSPPVTPIPSTPSIRDIENILAIYGQNKFKTDFGFEYKGDQTVPADLYPGSQVQGVAVLLFIKNGDSDDLSESVESQILQKISFPSWAQDRASDSLLNTIINLSRANTAFSWRDNRFNESYSNPESDINQFSTASQLVYSNSTLTENGVTLNVMAFYYVGVYYLAKVEDPF